MTTSKADGSQVATVDTEHTLTTITDTGTFQLTVDADALTEGDTVVLRVKHKVRSTGTTRLAYQATYSHTQAEPVKFSLPVPSLNELVFTLEQTDGTGRTFPWEVIEI